MKLEVISLIFRSTKFLKFTENQMLKYCKNFDDIEVSHRIIANDATKNVLEAATDCSIPVWEFNNTNPNEYYKTLNITPSIHIHKKTIEHIGFDEK